MLQISTTGTVLIRRSLIEQNQSEMMIGLQFAKWMCIIVLWAKLINSTSAPIKEGQIQSPSIFTSPFICMSLIGELLYCGIPPSIPDFFAVQVGAQQVVGIHSSSYIVFDEKHCKSSLSPKNPVQRPMNRPGIQTYWSRVYNINYWATVRHTAVHHKFMEKPFYLVIIPGGFLNNLLI